MKILHTSDWHLGRSLYGRNRYREHSAFLDWLLECINEQRIDALLVAGDIFDTATPSNRSQELYYRFLFQVSTSCCRHVVVIGGNHDSPTFLNAPKELLLALHVYVIGSKTENPADEVLVLYDKQELPAAIICAVPYLRDRDLRTVEAGESMEEKNSKLAYGLQKHYEKVCAIAEEKQEKLQKKGFPAVPVIAMGHLFTANGKTVEGDGVRDLYVGSLAHIEAAVFPAGIDYLALGHLHVPQRIKNHKHFRYCGSPLAMGFGEAQQRKTVLAVEFDKNRPLIEEIPVPRFQELVRITGTLDDILAKLTELKRAESRAWLEIEYTGKDIVPDLRSTVEEVLLDSGMEIRLLKNSRTAQKSLRSLYQNETLDDLDENDVFERCLDTFAIPSEERKKLTAAYREILNSLHAEDSNAE
ncbi:MAG: exonuclease sbcCD subunit D [Desulfocapsa sp.]|nr:MAG: exonuclease sbcCD subunit D [Desulfocapsa sp.]